MTRRVPYRHDRHEVQNFLEVLRADGVEVRDDHLEAWISEEEGRFADEYLAGGDPGEKGVVAIHPFSADPARAWHEDNFVALANALQDRERVGVLLLGGPRDRVLADSMAGRILPGPRMAVGATTLRQSMALLSRCRLLVCNDSGVMHLCAAVGVPLVALFGPQSPDKFGPWGPRAEVITKRFQCSPCRQRFFEECRPSPRGKPYCMEEITVDEVLEKALRALRSPAAGQP